MEPTPSHTVFAEDNPADVGLVRVALREHAIDCDLLVISDGEEVLSFSKGLDRDRAFPYPDLLLLDLNLPERDGTELLRELRCAQTPVVVLTSSNAPADRKMAEDSAAVHYFRKPMSLAQFMDLGRIVKDALGCTNTC